MEKLLNFVLPATCAVLLVISAVCTLVFNSTPMIPSWGWMLIVAWLAFMDALEYYLTKLRGTE